MLNLEKINNGTQLKVTCENPKDLEDLLDLEIKRGTCSAWCDGLDYPDGPIGNGWHTLSPEDIGALTDDPHLITDDMEMDDQGNVVYVGRVFFYPKYAIQSLFEDIQENGFAILNSME